MRVLVTGGAGFIGAHLVPMLRDNGDDVVVLDNLAVGKAVPTESPTMHTVVASLGDEEAAKAIVDFAPEVVFHLAAMHFIPWCEQHPAEAEAANVEGTRWLLDLLDEVNPRAVVFASTVAVYGFHDHPADESMPREPSSVYARTKVSGEDLMHAYSARHPDATVGLPRFANVYGVGDPNPHLIPSLCRDLGGEIQVGNLWPERDYIHADDISRAVRAIAELPAGVHTLNVGTGVGTTVETIVSTLATLSGVPMTTVSVPERVRADDGHLVSDPSALKNATGWTPQVSLEEGLAGILRAENIDVVG